MNTNFHEFLLAFANLKNHLRLFVADLNNLQNRKKADL